MSLLQVEQLTAGYGGSQVLFGIDLAVDTGELVTLLGRNGMGKTTTINSIMGLVPPRGGRIVLDSAGVNGLPPYRIAQAGIALVPEGRQIFPNLTARENLLATARESTHATHEHWTFDRVLELFPGLANRLDSMGNLLSGGEQMLAIGRALMTNPRVLLLDDATEGLAPQIRGEIWRCLRQLRDAGLGIIVVDKHVEDLLPIASRHHVMEKGRIVWQGSSLDWRSAGDLRERYLGV